MTFTHRRRLATGLLSVLSLSACAGGSTPISTSSTAAVRAPSPSPSTAAGGHVRGWIIGGSTLADLRAHDPSGVVTRTLDSPTTFVVVGGSGDFPQGWKAIPTQSFTRSENLVDAVNGGKLAKGVQAVLLDIERWTLTPPEDQNDPAAAYAKAYAAARAHDLKLVATPGVDLAAPTAKREHEDAWRAYLDDLQLPSKIAPYADVFEVQSQSQEQSRDRFSQLLGGAEAQVHTRNPKASVFGGVSTNPNGSSVTAAQMADAVGAAAHHGIAGYWLNDPRHSQACGKCTGPFPAMAVEFLVMLDTGAIPE